MVESRFKDGVTANAYETLLLPLVFNPWGKVLIAKAGLRKGSRVLDVATGPGTLARLVAAELGPAGRVIGADTSPQMLGQARAKPPIQGGAALDYVEASAETLPFQAAGFDSVFCQQGLQFFPDPLAALKEMKRVLKPGGRVVLSLWSDAQAMSLFASVHDALDATLAQPPSRAALGWLDIPRLEGLLASAGFAGSQVTEETLVVALEGGFPQALACVAGTTASAAVRSMDASERERFESLLAKILEPWFQGSELHVPTRALVAVATA